MTTAHPAPGLLHGLRVIDLTTVLAGPGGTQILGDLGAEVIKVEPPFGDETRRMGPPVYHDGSAGPFVNVNRNKRNISLDLATPEGREVLLRLLDGADVLFENFKPGTLEKWGIGYDAVLKARFPRLIYAAVTAYGGDGPLGNLPGYDPMMQGYCGIMDLNGEAGGDPLRVNLPAVDWVATLYAVIGVTSAVIERQRSGLGQAVRVSLYDAALSLLHPFATNWLLKGLKATRMGSRHTAAAPYDIYPTRDGHMILLVNSLRQFHALCDVLDLPDLRDDPGLQTATGRVAQIGRLDARLRPIFAAAARDDLVARFQRGGVSAAPVLDIAEALSHPQLVGRGGLLEGADGYRGLASPMRFDRSPVQLRSVPAVQGADTRAVLRGAGLDEATIDRLIAAGIAVAAPAAERASA